MRVRFQESKPVTEGFYLARLDGLEETMHAQYGKNIKWTFTIIEAPNQPDALNTTVTAMSSMKVSPKSKLFLWLQAFDVILGDNDDFEMDSLLGKTVKVRIKNNTKTTVVDGRESTTTYSNVDALAKYVPQAQQATPAPTTQPTQVAPTQVAPTVAQPDLAVDEEFEF